MEKRSPASWAGGGRGRGGAEALSSQLFPISMSASLRIRTYPCIFVFCFSADPGMFPFCRGLPGVFRQEKDPPAKSGRLERAGRKQRREKLKKESEKKDIPMYAGAPTPHRDSAIHPFIPFFLDPPLSPPHSPILLSPSFPPSRVDLPCFFVLPTMIFAGMEIHYIR